MHKSFIFVKAEKGIGSVFCGVGVREGTRSWEPVHCLHSPDRTMASAVALCGRGGQGSRGAEGWGSLNRALAPQNVSMCGRGSGKMRGLGEGAAKLRLVDTHGWGHLGEGMRDRKSKGVSKRFSLRPPGRGGGQLAC